MSQPRCLRCGHANTRRMHRLGVWQRVILPWFHLFPWECTACRKVFIAGSRGKVRTHAQEPAKPAQAEAEEASLRR